MKLIESIKKGYRRLFKQGGYGLGSITEILDSARLADKYKSYAFACINARAENIAKAKIYLYRIDRNSGERKEVKDHGFLTLLNQPNKKNQTFRELLHKISSSLDLYGNSYLYIHRGIGGKPSGLYFLPSQFVRAVTDTKSSLIEHYAYISGNRIIKYPCRDIIHFLIPDPDGNLNGKPTVSGFNFTLDIDYLQNLYQRNFYRNDAAPGLIIESESRISDEQYERLRESLLEKNSGAGNAGSTLILDSGIKARPYQSSPKDVEILPARKMIRDEILALFRVPKTILGIAEDINRATAREQLKTFNDYVIKPFAKICIESKLNLFIRENYQSENLELKMEYEFEIDRELQLRAYDIYRKYDIVSPEEIREMEGFGKREKI